LRFGTNGGFRYQNSELQGRNGTNIGWGVKTNGVVDFPNAMETTYINIKNSGGSSNPTIRFNATNTGLYGSSVNGGGIRYTQGGSVGWTLGRDQLTFNNGEGNIRSENDDRGFFLSGRLRDNDEPSFFTARSTNSGTVVMYTTGDNNDSKNEFYANGSAGNDRNDWGGTSDIRRKENITPAGSQWDDVKSYNFVNYNLINGDPNDRMFGVIAQELQQTSPGLVCEGKNGYLRVKTSILNLKAVKALQEAMDRIETLEARVDQLENP